MLKPLHPHHLTGAGPRLAESLLSTSSVKACPRLFRGLFLALMLALPGPSCDLEHTSFFHPGLHVCKLQVVITVPPWKGYCEEWRTVPGVEQAFTKPVRVLWHVEPRGAALLPAGATMD